MSTWLKVVRYHLVQPALVIGLPWANLAFAFIVNLIIAAEHPTAHPVVTTSQGLAATANDGGFFTGAVVIPYIYFFVTGLMTISRSLPFGLALGASRRSFYAGTALLGVGLAAVDAVGLTALQAIERVTNGWGVDMHFFRVPYILNGPWYLTWLTSFTGLAVLFALGMWFGVVHRRWGLIGNVLFIAGQVSALLAATLIVSFANAWPAVGHFFISLTTAGLSGLLVLLTLALLAGGHATIRRATV